MYEVEQLLTQSKHHLINIGTYLALEMGPRCTLVKYRATEPNFYSIMYLWLILGSPLLPFFFFSFFLRRDLSM